MKIVIMVEGKTERVLMAALRRFLEPRLQGRMPKLDPKPFHGRIPRGDQLKGDVRRHLDDRKFPADAVIALTDVYTGSVPPEFRDAEDAKRQLRLWVGEEPRFHPHAAQFEFEAWLLPFWDDLRHLAGHNLAEPGPDPEMVNHLNPPSRRIGDLFRRGSTGRGYVKERDAARVLRGRDLGVSAQRCLQLREFLNTILRLCGGQTL
ncbi:MAG: hypothetical protein GHCLOJNM_01787 [bacterium]|nr:hypothetical protein [bacterium]